MSFSNAFPLNKCMGKGILIGLGTGRCGTTSLAHLLNAVRGCHVSHEHNDIRSIMSWDFKEEAAKKALEILARRGGVAGDVAFYYLPYARWIAQASPEARFVCMMRDREETIDSYMRKTLNRDHWSSRCLGRDAWDRMYPKFDTQDKKTALGMYWDSYYREVGELEKSGVCIKTFRTEDLNSEEGVGKILKFCGLDYAPNLAGIKKNRLGL